MAAIDPTPPPEPTEGFVARIIAGSAAHPIVTLLFVAALAVFGWLSLRETPLDAIPDLSDTQVIIVADWPGRAPSLVEDQITYPISAALVSAPRVQSVRGQSAFGLSLVYVIFEDGTDLYWARSRVLEYLDSVRGRLPEGVTPTLGPDATGVGWVFEYALVDRSGQHDLQELRALQDWNLRYALASVPGVAEVASVGGFVKQYQVHVDPNRLLEYRIALDDVIEAVRDASGAAGGGLLDLAGHEQIVRGRAYVERIDDLVDAPIGVGPDGAPIRVSDVASVTVGPEERRGVADLDGEGEVVGGIVVMRYGENALAVIDRVKVRLREIEPSLPRGVEIVPTYDRSKLIREAVDTLRQTLIEEMVVVAAVVFFFLLHVRSALVPVLTLPIAVLIAFVPMRLQGISANIMSLGGIAVAIGEMIDGSIILLDNVHKRLEAWDDAGRPTPRALEVVRAMQEVGPSIFFSLLVMTVSFLPVFTLQATEGRLFRPLAFTKSYSMGFAAVLAITMTPALVALFLRGRFRREDDNPISRWLVAIYVPVVRFVVRYRKTVIVLAILAMAFTWPAFRRLETEFMPPLNEGVILYMPSSPPGMSVAESARVLRAMDRALAEVPEVMRVFGKIGRADTATDPAPLGMAETVVLLRPRRSWREGLTWEGLIAELDAKLQIPGMPNIWWMPIQTRTEMLSTGVRSPLGIQVFGDDLASIEATALSIEQAVRDVPGTRSVFAERASGGYFLDVDVDRPAAARHGIRVADIHDALEAAVGGIVVGQTIQGRERYDLVVRYARELRDTPAAIERVLVRTAHGSPVPLGQVARVVSRTGAPMIRSEGGKLVGYVFVDTDRPIVDYVADAREAVSARATLAPGTRLEWVGQFRHFERAKERLLWIVPLTLALVVVLLWFSTRSWIETSIVMLAVPFSLIGAVWLLYLLDYHVSVAVWVGLIALAGLDAETGVVMLLYLTLSHRAAVAAGKMRSADDLEEAIVDGAARRIRPKIMTVLTTMVGLLPVLLSEGTGADVMKRIAAPLVGGVVTSFLLELTVYPAIFASWKSRAITS